MQRQTTFAAANATKYPEPVAIAIAKDPGGSYNPITLGWCTQTSFDPPMYAISVGKSRHSLAVIRAAGEFTLAFPSSKQAQAALHFGSVSGREADKLAQVREKTCKATKIDSLLLEDAVANFECEVAGELESGDHVLFVGKVLAAHVNTRALKRLFAVGQGHELGEVAAVVEDAPPRPQ